MSQLNNRDGCNYFIDCFQERSQWILAGPAIFDCNVISYDLPVMIDDTNIIRVNEYYCHAIDPLIPRGVGSYDRSPER